MRRYPLGVQVFEKIVRENYLYVDKTRFVWDLANGPAGYVFLSRPRRFGKTLLTTTLKAYFEGKRELFKGLALEALERDWTKYPVLHFSLNGIKGADAARLEQSLDALLYDYEKVYGLPERAVLLNDRLRKLIETAHEKTGRKVVVLVDEYDAPLLDVAHEEENLPALRQVMRNFYAPLKMSEEHLRFVFLTGITKFSQLSLFSAFNNIDNISMDREYASICGITEGELEGQLGEGVEAMAQSLALSREEALEALKSRYDGYHFAWPSPGVYNPYSLLMALSKQRLDDYWFSSGTPTFLIDHLRAQPENPIELGTVIETGKGGFDVPIEEMENAIPLLFQSGYLTLKGYRPDSDLYALGIPNGEVRRGLMENLLPLYSGGTRIAGSNTAGKMRGLLSRGDMDGALHLLRTYLGTVPQTDRTGYEGHWQQMLYIIFSLIGFKLDVEVRTSRGRMDLALHAPDTTYIIEVKVDRSADEALRQIITHDYPARFALGGKPLTLVGVNFSTQDRNLTDWVIAPAQGS